MVFQKRYFAFLISFLCFNSIFSLPSSFQNLNIDFIREEEAQTGAKNIMTGSMFFSSSPYCFIFETKEPVSQIAYSNSDGTFILEDDIVYDYQEGSQMMSQTCLDILNWFKSDCALSEQGYAPTKNQKDGNLLKTTWLYAKVGVHPFEKIIVYSDIKGRFVKLQMYTKDDELFAQTELENFEQYMGSFYPTSIITKTYFENEIFATTKLSFSNIKINQKDLLENQNITYIGQTLFVQDSQKLTQISKTKSSVLAPQIQNFSSSIFSMIINAAFSFYQKFITDQDNSSCPFYPTCSRYMREAVSKHGAFGIIMGIERLKRCTSYEHSRGLYPVVNGHYHLDKVP